MLGPPGWLQRGMAGGRRPAPPSGECAAAPVGKVRRAADREQSDHPKQAHRQPAAGTRRPPRQPAAPAAPVRRSGHLDRGVARHPAAEPKQRLPSHGCARHGPDRRVHEQRSGHPLASIEPGTCPEAARPAALQPHRKDPRKSLTGLGPVNTIWVGPAGSRFFLRARRSGCGVAGAT